MPECLAPGVYVEEVSFRGKSIEGVSTSTVGFIGLAQYASAPVLVSSFADFLHISAPGDSDLLGLAVRGFFENGGRLGYVARIAPGDPVEKALDSLSDPKLRISILCCPDEHRLSDAGKLLTENCEKLKDRVCILQSPQSAPPPALHQPPVNSAFAAYYHPWITVQGLHSPSPVLVPPGGHIAGVYARTDTEKGVQVAPAGVALLGVTALEQAISAADSAVLSQHGVNVIRNFPVQGNLVWGARTTSSDPDWKYINVRRLLIFVEQSMQQGLQWVVFEPNTPALWIEVRTALEEFLRTLWKSGAIPGAKQDEAFFVRCDPGTMTQSDIESGRLVAEVGIAPIKPAEFVILRITCQHKQPA